MSAVKLVWVTPDADALIVKMARVSNPAGQDSGEGAARLIRYLARNRHWSPFEMVAACVEVTTTRDVSRQICRHRSLSVQEFSQRYQSVDALPEPMQRKARLSHPTNRQASLPAEDEKLVDWWDREQARVQSTADFVYRRALEKGIAKEVARAVLPEGLTSTRMYVQGTIRSWIHFLQVRIGHGTQPETEQVAMQIRDVLRAACPLTMTAVEDV